MANDALDVDFRALVRLVQVHRHRSFTRAAEELRVNQSAVSYTVEKLRRAFRDPLFVREGGATVPTARCEQIIAQAQGLVDGYLALTEAARFEPGTATQRVVIACNFYERVLILPGLAHALRRQAPGMTLEIIDSADMGHERLLRAEADFLIGPFQRKDAAFFTRRLYTDRYVCLMDKGHPMAGRALTIEAYQALQHINITYGGAWKSSYMQELDRLGYQLDYALRVPSPAGIESLVRESELVATLPEKLARQIGGDLCVTPCPVPAPVEIQLTWTARCHASDMHVWLRNLIAGSVVAAFGPAAGVTGPA